MKYITFRMVENSAGYSAMCNVGTVSRAVDPDSPVYCDERATNRFWVATYDVDFSSRFGQISYWLTRVQVWAYFKLLPPLLLCRTHARYYIDQLSKSGIGEDDDA